MPVDIKNHAAGNKTGHVIKCFPETQWQPIQTNTRTTFKFARVTACLE